TPAQTVNWVSEAMAHDLREGRFITLFMAELDVKHHTLQNANAGHAPALIFKAESRRCVYLSSTGLPLGFSDDLPCQAGERHDIAPGDVLVLATDGLIERKNPVGEYYGSARLEAAIQSVFDRKAEQIVEAIKQSLAEFAGTRPPDDDLTLVVIRRTG
ncbi:MAG: PP2C family protein-serine/threonine phosphatase, partial [Planctomycetaceae bacterium]